MASSSPQYTLTQQITAQSKAHYRQDLLQAYSLTAIGLDKFGQTLGEDPARTSVIRTAELPYYQAQPYVASTPGQVGYSAPVMAMEPGRFLSAHRAGDRQGSAGEGKLYGLGVDGGVFEPQARYFG